MSNFDQHCADCGASIADALEKDKQGLVNGALSVLLEQGTYSLFLYLCSRGEADQSAATVIREKTVALLKQGFFSFSEEVDGKDPKKLLDTLRNDMEGQRRKAILAKDVLETALVYTRYHLKAK